jgi:hypothetical protein
MVLGNTAIYSQIVESLGFSVADKNTLSQLLYSKEEKKHSRIFRFKGKEKRYKRNFTKTYFVL